MAVTVSQDSPATPTPEQVYEDLPLYIRTLRDLVRPDTEKVYRFRESFQKALGLAQNYVAEVVDRLEYYPGERRFSTFTVSGMN